MNAVIFTDLDGTLIDHTYDAAAASDAIRCAQDAGIPICMCSSKTRSEILHFRRTLGIADPFISENGGAIFIPKGYFDAAAAGEPEESFEIIELGTPYYVLVAAVRLVSRQLGIQICGFHGMTAGELAKKCGLRPDLAKLALEREYDEPFWIGGDEANIERVANALRRRSFQVTRGSRFHHVTGANDKGKAVAFLSRRFRSYLSNAILIGIGDSPNDIPMLKQVDIPVLVKGQSGTYDEETCYAVPNLRLAGGVGPHGWSSAVKTLLSEWE